VQVYLIVVYNFELYMLPLTVVVIFLFNYLLVWYMGLQNKDNVSIISVFMAITSLVTRSKYLEHFK